MTSYQPLGVSNIHSQDQEKNHQPTPILIEFTTPTLFPTTVLEFVAIHPNIE